MKTKFSLFLILIFLYLYQAYQIGYVNVGYASHLSLVVTKTSFSQMIPLNWTNPVQGTNYFMRIFGSDYSSLDYLSYIVNPNLFSPSNGGVQPGRIITSYVNDIINISGFEPSTTHGHIAVGYQHPRQNYGTAVSFGGILNGTTLSEKLIISYRGERISLLSKPFLSTFARAYHTAILIETVNPTNSSNLGFVYMWGGIDSISGPGVYSYSNDLIRMDLPVWRDDFNDTTNIAMTQVTQTDQPTARAGHSAVLYNGNMIIFGGHDSTTYYNGIHSCDLSSFSWFSNTPADIPRAYHSATMVGDYMYIFGGTPDGSTVLSDLMYYDFSSETWTIVDMLDAIPPRAGHTTLKIEDGFLVHGGTDFDKEFDDWWVISPNDPKCIVFCPAIQDCVNTQTECDSYLACSGDTPFGCNGSCHASPSSCPSQTCETGQVLCWNGQCSDSISTCLPWPACPFEYSRCSDGTCKQNCVTSPTTCGEGTTLCVDGTCASECMPYLGCLPGTNIVACSDGTCARSLKDCNVDCATRSHCWDHNCRETCDLSFFSTQVVSTDFSFSAAPNTITPFDVYRVGTTFLNPSDPTTTTGQALFTIHNTGTSTLHINGTMRSASMGEIVNAGPYPTWNSAYDPYFFLTSVVSVEVNGIEPKDDGIAAQLFFSPDPTNPNELSVATGCVAQLVDWYWVELIDANNTNPSAFILEEPFKSYYLLFNTETGRAVPTQDQIDAIPTPAKRWKCVEGEFPLVVTTASGEYAQYPGSTIDFWAPTAIIRTPGMPAAVPPADYSFVQYGISIGFGVVFLSFLGVLLILIATQDN